MIYRLSVLTTLVGLHFSYEGLQVYVKVFNKMCVLFCHYSVSCLLFIGPPPQNEEGGGKFFSSPTAAVSTHTHTHMHARMPGRAHAPQTPGMSELKMYKIT